MIAHFINIDLIVKNESKAWIVDKGNPNIPIIKIENSDLNLFKSGIYKSHNNKINFNGKTFWLSNDFMTKLKIKSKKYKVDISNLVISFQEFLNPELIENIKFEIDKSFFNKIVNTNDDIYILCSKNKKENFKNQIEKLIEELKDIGLTIKNIYYLSETFFNNDEDEIAYTKNKIILQHLVGLKLDGNKFSNVEIQDYSKIFYYDDNKKSIELSKNINDLLEKFLLNSEDSLKTLVKDKIKRDDNIIIVKEYTHNKANKFNEFTIQLECSNLIRSFENFNFFSSSSPR
jgi:hypothetical protein